MRAFLPKAARLLLDFPEAISLLPLLREAAWESLPQGWTEDSVQSFWKNLGGDGEHKVTACMEKMEGKISNPGAFCASLRDRVEGKDWRSERSAKDFGSKDELAKYLQEHPGADKSKHHGVEKDKNVRKNT